MNQIIKRAMIAVVIFIIVFSLGGPIIRSSGYDAYLEAIFYLAGIIAAGCYWIGSNELAYNEILIGTWSKGPPSMAASEFRGEWHLIT